MSFLVLSGARGPTAASADPYDLGTVPFAYDWPTAPVTTDTIEVDTIAEFQAAVAQGSNGHIVNVAAGTYTGDIDVKGSDLDIRVSNSATITGHLWWGDGDAPGDVRTARVKWTGGNLIDGGMGSHPIEDLLVDDFFVDNLASVSSQGIHNLSGITGNMPEGWARMAWINSTIGLRGGDTGGGWTFFCGGTSSPNGTLILANAKLLSADSAQNNRFITLTNLIIVDSVFNPDGLSGNSLRIHDGCDNVLVRDSWARGLFKMDPTTGSAAQATNATFLRFERYDNDNPFVVQGTGANTGSCTDCVYHSLAGGSPFSVSPLTGSVSHVSWDGSTVPSYSAVGAQR